MLCFGRSTLLALLQRSSEQACVVHACGFERPLIRTGCTTHPTVWTITLLPGLPDGLITSWDSPNLHQPASPLQVDTHAYSSSARPANGVSAENHNGLYPRLTEIPLHVWLQAHGPNFQIYSLIVDQDSRRSSHRQDTISQRGLDPIGRNYRYSAALLPHLARSAACPRSRMSKMHPSDRNLTLLHS
jgi:hypothetical protein